jgi:hypothetical protein
MDQTCLLLEKLPMIVFVANLCQKWQRGVMYFKKIRTIVFTGWLDAMIWIISVILWVIILVHVKRHQALEPLLALDRIEACHEPMGIDERIQDGIYQHIVFRIKASQLQQCLMQSLKQDITYAYFKKEDTIWEVHLARDFVLRPDLIQKQPYRYSDISKQGITQRKKGAT